MQIKLSLTHFDGEIADVSAGENISSTAGAENGVDTDTSATPSKAEEFERLIKGEYREEYDKRMQSTVQRRLRGQKQANSRLQGVMDKVAARYGLDSGNIDAIEQAIDNDNSYIERYAEENGLTYEQGREFQRLKSENERFRKMQERNAFNAIFSDWQRQGEALRELYPSFDLRTELDNKRFMDVLRGGYSVREAYEFAHSEDIMSKALAYTAQHTKESTVNNILAKGARPPEGATGNHAGVSTAVDVSKMTREQREELIERAARGEKITF